MIILNITRWRARLNRTPRPHRSTSQQPPQHQIALSVWPLTPRPSLNLTRGLFTGWLHFSWDISYCKGYKPVWKHKYVKMTRDKKQRKTMLFISGFLFWLFSHVFVSWSLAVSTLLLLNYISIVPLWRNVSFHADFKRL